MPLNKKIKPTSIIIIIICLLKFTWFQAFLSNTNLLRGELIFCGGVRPPKKCPRYDTKQSDGEIPVMLELWGMGSPPSLPSLPGPLQPGVLANDRVLSLGQIELNCILMLN